MAPWRHTRIQPSTLAHYLAVRGTQLDGALAHPLGGVPTRGRADMTRIRARAAPRSMPTALFISEFACLHFSEFAVLRCGLAGAMRPACRARMGLASRGGLPHPLTVPRYGHGPLGALLRAARHAVTYERAVTTDYFRAIYRQNVFSCMGAPWLTPRPSPPGGS